MSPVGRGSGYCVTLTNGFMVGLPRWPVSLRSASDKGNGDFDIFSVNQLLGEDKAGNLVFALTSIVRSVYSFSDTSLLLRNTVEASTCRHWSV